MNDWKTIDLEVTSINMLIQTVGDIGVPQRERAEPSIEDTESQQRKTFPNGCGTGKLM